MLETRLKAVETAIVRLTVAIDKMTEAHYAALKRVTVPATDTRPRARKPIKPKQITRDRLIELANRYIRVKGQEDFDILLTVFNIKTLAKLHEKSFESFYSQMIRELHQTIEG